MAILKYGKGSLDRIIYACTKAALDLVFAVSIIRGVGLVDDSICLTVDLCPMEGK